VPFLTKTARID